MGEQPDIVTFVLTDVEGSTRLWDQVPHAMVAAVEQLDAIVADAVAGADGDLIKPRGEGDSHFAVFTSATGGVEAAVAIQRALAAADWPTPEPIRVRIAVHTGEAGMRERDYYGSTVNRCARIRGLGHGGQTLVSAPTVALVRDALPERVRLDDLGSYRLRGLRDPEHVFQLTDLTLESTFPALRSIEVLPHNLPEPMTAFVGRARELDEICEVLARARLVTLTGSAGCGKTRLALEAALTVLDRFPDGAWLVELAAVAEETLVLEELARAIGARPERGASLMEAVLDVVAHRTMLIVLDNCEHVLMAAASLTTELLSRCPRLVVLATSREALGIAGEVSWRVPSMHVPADPGSLAEADAGRLFLERARAASPGFDPSPADAASIARVCGRLDGIPLAIELAAARVGVLGCGQLAERLDDMFMVLTGGSRTALERQQTMRAAVDWSHALLAQPERILLRRLSVFAGGFTLEDCEGICADGELERAQILGVLAGLVDKSLVVMEPRPGGARYRLLETIRQYAREKLAESGEGTALRTRHLDHWRAIANEASGALEGPEQDVWLARLDDEHDNVRAALDWALVHDPAAGVEIAHGVRWFWIARANWLEGRRWAEALLAREVGDPMLEARCLEVCALQALLELDLPAAETWYRDLVERASTLGDDALQVRALSGLAEVAAQGGRADEVRRLTERALPLARRLGDLRQLSHLLSEQANVAEDAEEGRRLFGEAIEAARAAGDLHTIAIMLNERAVHEALVGAYRHARALAEEALVPARAIGDMRLVASFLRLLAWIAFQQTDHATARRLFEEAAAVQRSLGGEARIGHALSFEAMVAVCDGDLLRARAQLEESVSVLRRSEVGRHLVTVQRVLGEVCARLGDRVGARAHLGEALAGGERSGNLGLAASARVLLAREEHEDGDDAAASAQLSPVLDAWPSLDPVIVASALEVVAALRPADGTALLAAAEAMRSEAGIPVQPFYRPWLDGVIDAARAASAGFEKEWEIGRALSTGEAAARALAILRRVSRS